MALRKRHFNAIRSISCLLDTDYRCIPVANLFSQSQSVISQIVGLLWIIPLGYMGQGVVILIVSSLNAMHNQNRR